MLFNSQAFLLGFLPVALLLYYSSYKFFGVAGSLTVLVFLSLFFYAWWNPYFLPLLCGSVLINYALGRGLALTEGHNKTGILLVGLLFNLGLLGYFKYAGFFVNSANAVLGQSDVVFDIVLPLGISFFTFQQVSYLVDAWRRKAPSYGLLDYSAYVTFFPQLIAGPIVRHRELVPQFTLSPLREGLYQRCAHGAALLAIGLGKKVLLADSLAEFVDPVYAAATMGQAISTYEAWMVSTAFSLQVYFDFSGYSDMALGMALMFGYKLPFNFNAPFAATDLRAFWQRWHMTLSRFLRDYLFVPIARYRQIPLSRFVAISATMLLCGLWHGASWTFVVWGGLHGVGLAVNTVFSKSKLRLPDGVGWFLTIGFFVVLANLFRAETFNVAIEVWRSMVNLVPSASDIKSQDIALVLIAGALAVVGPTSQTFVLERLKPNRLAALALGGALTLLVLFVGADIDKEFVYFQF
jgi:alginate O-acetyltransferase complex protein AlgI